MKPFERLPDEINDDGVYHVYRSKNIYNDPKVVIVDLRRRSFFKRLIMIPRMWRKQVMIMSWGTWNQWRANISHMIVSVKIVLGK